MNINEIERVVKSFQGVIFKRSSSVSAGLFKSKIRGSGLQFRDHQIYSHGDDVRFIDWKVSARNSNIHLKTFEEERNSLIYVLLDISPTMYYGSNKTTKLQASLEICALLYLLTQKTNDQLTLILLINNQSFTLPPLKGKMGIVSLVKQLEKLEVYDQDGGVNLSIQRVLKNNSAELLETEIKKIISKRRDVILLSDFNMQESFINNASKSRYFHPLRIVSPIDLAPLRFSIFSGKIKGTGLSLNQGNLVSLPTLATSEKYLELFLRRLK
jgi:uncharacterized protein (DUF58 family)